MRQKIQTLLDHINHGLIERESTAKSALLSVLAGEHMVLIGPPGTGKSLLARRIAQCLGGAHGSHGLRYFEYLLTKFSTPEELFGPLSISHLKADRFHRNTAGYLPCVELGFLDEIFKASSSILNSLLSIMNERIYHNGAEVQHVPLRSLIAASNELPSGQEELSALYDRFLVRCFVDYVGPESMHSLLSAAFLQSTPRISESITSEQIETLQKIAQSVTFPSSVIQAIQHLWLAHREAFKEDKRELISDRRMMKCLRLLSVSAASNGRVEVDLSDILLLKDCLWNHPSNAHKVRSLILDVLQRHDHPAPADEPEDAEENPHHACILGKSGGNDLNTGTSRKRSHGGISFEISPISVRGQLNAKIKGFHGKGTEHDPLLVKSAEDLSYLNQPEVGMQGYHFQQTADIDCRQFTSWMDIEFSGVFDGGGFKIETERDEEIYLFTKTNKGSIVRNIKLNGFNLTKLAEETKIHHCSFEKNRNAIEEAKDSQIYFCSSHGKSIPFSFQNTGHILGNASNSTIKFCQSSNFLIEHDALECEIISCSAEESLIGRSAEKCKIKDCHIHLNISQFAVASTTRNSTVERLFIHGDYSNSTYTGYNGGISRSSDNSHIENCLLGEISGGDPDYRIYRKDSSTTLLNNYSIDSNEYHENYGSSDKNGSQGESISTAIVSQRFCENYLNWDFENIWSWNDEENIPVLRHAGSDAFPMGPMEELAPSSISGKESIQQKESTESLLARQLRNNIWL